MAVSGSTVRLVELGPRDGVVRGVAGGYQWEARLTRSPVSYGIDPRTLYKGAGRIVRLVLYDQMAHAEAGRKVAAFDKGWMFGRIDHLAVIRRVVDYLER